MNLAAWSRAVRDRDGNRCRRCGSTQGIDAAHIIGRAKPRTRYVLENGIALCRLCHQDLDQHPERKARFAIEILGAAAYRRLVFRSNLTVLSRHEHRFVNVPVMETVMIEGVWGQEIREAFSTAWVCEECGEPGFAIPGEVS